MDDLSHKEKEEKQIQYLLSDLLDIKEREIQRRRNDLEDTQLSILNSATVKELQQQNIFLEISKDRLESKLLEIEKNEKMLKEKHKEIILQKNAFTKRMIYDQMIPFSILKHTIHHIRNKSEHDDNFIKKFHLIEKTIPLMIQEINRVVQFNNLEEMK